MEICGIYTITCIINGKIYVGYSNDIEKRFKEHRRELNNDIHTNDRLQKAWNKYGIDNFIFEVLEEYEAEFLSSMENWWCNMLNSHNRNIGYNIQSTNPYGKFSCSEETLEKIRKVKSTPEYKSKMSLKLTGKKRSPEDVMKMSERAKGRKHSPETLSKMKGHKGGSGMKGMKHTEEVKKRISDANKGKKKSKEQVEKLRDKLIGRKASDETKDKLSISHSKTIIQMDLEGNFIREWRNARIAAEFYNIHKSNIAKCCIGKKKTSAGFKWKYKE